MTSAIQVDRVMPVGAVARSASSGEDCRDVARELFGLLAGRIAAQNSKLLVDQELGEIPLDRLRAQEAARAPLEGLERADGRSAPLTSILANIGKVTS